MRRNYFRKLSPKIITENYYRKLLPKIMSENCQLVYQSRRKCEIYRDTGVSKIVANREELTQIIMYLTTFLKFILYENL